jgi:hypothetical protein
MTQTNPTELIKTAHLLFTLRDEIASVLVEKLSVDAQGQIEGHDAAAEEIIVRLGSEV